MYSWHVMLRPFAKVKTAKIIFSENSQNLLYTIFCESTVSMILSNNTSDHPAKEAAPIPSHHARVRATQNRAIYLFSSIRVPLTPALLLMESPCAVTDLIEKSCAQEVSFSFWFRLHCACRSALVWFKALPLTARCLLPLRVCPDGRVVCGVATYCWLFRTTALSCAEEVSFSFWFRLHFACRSALVWFKALPLTARCLASLRVSPDGRVVWGVATDFWLSRTTALSCAEEVSFSFWFPLHCACQFALMTEGAKAYPLTARCLASLRVSPDSRVVWGVSTDCWLSRTTALSCAEEVSFSFWFQLHCACWSTLVWFKALPQTARCLASLKGLPWWPSGLRRCHSLLAVSHHWGSALMAEWSKALSLTAGCLAPLPCLMQKKSHLAFGFVCIAQASFPWWPRGLRRFHWLLAVSHHWGSALIAEWSEALPLIAGCLAPLPCFVLKKSHLAFGFVCIAHAGLPWCGSRRFHWLLSVSHHWGSALMAEWSAALPLIARCLAPMRVCQPQYPKMSEKWTMNKG